MNTNNLKKQGKIISLNSVKGGVGKTTTSLNLVCAMINDLQKTTLIECDKNGNLEEILNLRSDYGHKKIDFFKPKNNQELVSKAIELSKNGINVIIDVGGYDDEMLRSSMVLSDLVIIPCSGHYLEFRALVDLNRIFAEIKENTKNDDFDGVSVSAYLLKNRIHHAVKNFDSFEIFNNNNGFKTLNTVIRNRKDYDDALYEGSSAIECNSTKNGKAADEIKELYSEIKQILNY